MDDFAYTPEVEARANTLYWDSGMSVNRIAEELDLSKSALYGIIAPLPTALGCPLCGSEVVFANRTAQQRGNLVCATCSWEGSEEETVAEVDVAAEVNEAASSAMVQSDALARPESSSSLTRTILGGAFLGAAAGLAIVLVTRRR